MTTADLNATKVIAANVKRGSLAALVPGSNTVAIGARLAEALGAQVGDSISLISPDGAVTPFGSVPRIVAYKVGAIFEVGIYDYDKAFVVMPMANAQTLLRLGDAVGMIEVVTTDPDRVDAILAPAKGRVARSGRWHRGRTPTPACSRRSSSRRPSCSWSCRSSFWWPYSTSCRR